jgi:hypothetical protein
VQEIIFLIVSISILGVLIWLSYKSHLKRFPTMFAVTLLCVVAYYLFQYGNLSSFSLKALSAEANFVREKKQEVAKDAKAVEAIRAKVEELLLDSQKSQAEILAINKQIEATAALAIPPTLTLTGKDTEVLTSGYKITLQFTPSKNEPLGSIVFVASIDDHSGAKILNFWPSIKGGAFSSGDDSKKISADGKSAQLSYSLISMGRPTFDLTLTKKARIRIEGNYFKNPIVVDTE